MTLLYQVGLLLLVAATYKVSAECCTPGATSDFCTVFSMLSTMEQNEVMNFIGENCDGDAEVALQKMEKRKPNFMRYGRSADPNFLRGFRSQPNFLRFGKASGDPNFLRFGRSDPNFLRFGKAAADPNFLRFGKRSADPNFLRFGRSFDNFDRESRKPNFLRFGK
nr:FMRFamide-like peptide=neuropeptide [Caenorhabditis elegans, Peptide, 164 aa] [Caenorhabditis elegans]